MSTRRAQRKKLAKKFKVGDMVTWGNGASYRRVTRVTATGVYVDAGGDWGERFIAFAPGSKSHREPGPPSL